MGKPDVLATGGPVAGRGAVLYPGAFPTAVAPEYPSAAEMARIAVTSEDVEMLLPSRCT